MFSGSRFRVHGLGFLDVYGCRVSASGGRLEHGTLNTRDCTPDPINTTMSGSIPSLRTGYSGYLRSNLQKQCTCKAVLDSHGHMDPQALNPRP